MPKMSKVGTLSWGEPSEKAFVCVSGVRNDRCCFITVAKCYEELHFVVLINKPHCFLPP
jgi:hypothetical protein